MIEEILIKLILMEAFVLMALSYKTPLRYLVIQALNCLKPAAADTYIFILFIFIASTFLVSLIISTLRIHFADSIDLAHQILLAQKLLQSCLLGFLLYLSMLIYKFHNLMRARSSLEKNLKVEAKQFERKKEMIAVEARHLKSEVARLRGELCELKYEYLRKCGEAEAKEAVASDLKKQSEKYNFNYDRLLEYNQTLRNQLQSIDQTLLENKQESRWSGLKAKIMRDGLNLSPRRIDEPDKNISEVCSDNKSVTTSRCYQLLHSGNSPPSLPRHRRPIYQH